MPEQLNLESFTNAVHLAHTKFLPDFWRLASTLLGTTERREFRSCLLTHEESYYGVKSPHLVSTTEFARRLDVTEDYTRAALRLIVDRSLAARHYLERNDLTVFAIVDGELHIDIAAEDFDAWFTDNFCTPFEWELLDLADNAKLDQVETSAVRKAMAEAIREAGHAGPCVVGAFRKKIAAIVRRGKPRRAKRRQAA